MVSFLRIKYPNSIVTGFHAQFHNIHTITRSVSFLVYWTIVCIHTKSSMLKMYVKSSVSVCYCGDMKCIQVKNGLWQFSTHKNDKLLCICVCVFMCVCVHAHTHACIHLFIQKKSPMNDNMTWCLYHYVVLNTGPAFNPWKHRGYNTCTTWIKIKHHCIPPTQFICMFHMTLL